MSIKLKDGDAALVFSNGRIEVHLPEDTKKNTVGQVLVAGFAARIGEDRAWAEELLDWSTGYLMNYMGEES